MNRNIRKLGLWSSAVSLAAFLIYTVCFVIIYAVNPPFTWTGTAAFIHYSTAYPQIFKYIAMAFMILFSFSFLIQLECLKEKVNPPLAECLPLKVTRTPS